MTYCVGYLVGDFVLEGLLIFVGLWVGRLVGLLIKSSLANNRDQPETKIVINKCVMVMSEMLNRYI